MGFGHLYWSYENRKSCMVSMGMVYGYSCNTLLIISIKLHIFSLKELLFSGFIVMKRKLFSHNFPANQFNATEFLWNEWCAPFHFSCLFRVRASHVHLLCVYRHFSRLYKLLLLFYQINFITADVPMSITDYAKIYTNRSVNRIIELLIF